MLGPFSRDEESVDAVQVNEYMTIDFAVRLYILFYYYRNVNGFNAAPSVLLFSAEWENKKLNFLTFNSQRGVDDANIIS